MDPVQLTGNSCDVNRESLQHERQFNLDPDLDWLPFQQRWRKAPPAQGAHALVFELWIQDLPDPHRPDRSVTVHRDEKYHDSGRFTRHSARLYLGFTSKGTFTPTKPGRFASSSTSGASLTEMSES